MWCDSAFPTSRNLTMFMRIHHDWRKATFMLLLYLWKNLEGRGSARIYIQERSLTYEIKNCSQRSIFHSSFRVHGERKFKINKSSCSLFLQTKVLLGKMHASSLSQCVTCCYKSDPGKLPVYKGVVIIHQHGGATILLGASPFLSPSNRGLMIFSLNSIGGHLFVFKWFHQMKNNFRGLGILWFPWREVM